MADRDNHERGQDGKGHRVDLRRGRKQRRSLFRRTIRGVGWLASGPADWAGVRSIGRGASLIGDLVRAVRERQASDRRFRVEDDRSFELRATALLHGVSVLELQRRLEARRRQTAWVAYGFFAFAGMFVLAWFHAVLSSSWTTSRVLLTVDFLPFGALFLLIGFYNALLNYQIRVGRRASWREYLMTNEPFLPR